MSELAKLRGAIQIASAATRAFRSVGVPAALESEIRQLEARLGGVGASRPPKDRIRDAVERFRVDSSDFRSVIDARLTAFGALERLAPDGYCLLEDTRLFPILLTRIEQIGTGSLGFRRCYQALLHIYFSFDIEAGQPAGQATRNFEILRVFLERSLPQISREGFIPEWLAAIREHSNLLTSRPVYPYGAKLLRGETDEIDSFRRRLEISEASWVNRRLVLVQVEAAAKGVDATFRRHLDPLLAVVVQHKVLLDEALALLVNRYAEQATPDVHPSLRDLCVATWKNPWLDQNAVKWGRVTPRAVQMVTSWLKRDLIREFFEVLSDDRQTDKRRLKFWEQYHESIDDMYFALGSLARRSTGADAKRIRAKLGSHVLELTDAGAPANNAFIMMMGNHVVVEFGVKGNACFVFDRDEVPFPLSGSVRGDREGLKHSSQKQRLLHFDAGGESWEETFSQALKRLGAERAKKPSPKARIRSVSSSASAVRDAARNDLSPAALTRLCRSHGIEWRESGAGRDLIVVECSNSGGAVADALREWGFDFSRHKGSWWRRGWK